jgi:diguanylate cyclase (GGDEF)-like protein/PAS domain S-box-containing protein
VNSSRKKNVAAYKRVRRIVGSLTLVALLCGVLFINHTREQTLTTSMHEAFHTEQELLAALLHEPLLRSDFVQVRATLHEFFIHQQHYRYISLKSANGFEIYSNTRGEKDSAHTWQVQITLNNKGLEGTTLELVKEEILPPFDWLKSYGLILLIIFPLILFLGQVLWQIIKQLGLDPISREVEREQISYQSLFNGCADGMVVRSCSGKLLKANKPFMRMLGYAENELTDSYCQKLCNKEICQHFQEVLDKKTVVFECQQIAKDGTQIPVEIHSTLITFEGECAVLNSIRDIRVRREKDFHLRQLLMVVENSHDGLMVTDTTGTILAVNKAFVEISGYSEDEVLGENPRILKSGLHSEHFYTTLWQELIENGFWQGEIYNRTKLGKVYPEWLVIRRINDVSGELQQYVAVFKDLSDQKAQEQKIIQLSQTDMLTGLPNQTLFRDRLQQAIIRASKKGDSRLGAQENKNLIAILYIGLDHFKKINDSFGHTVGDQVVVEVAQRLQQCIQKTDTLSRLRGDEFALMTSIKSEVAHIGALAEKILRALHDPLHVSAGDFFLTGSIGVALYPEDADSSADLMQNANSAMHQAKEQGRDRFCYFSTDFSTQASENLRMETLLHRALDNHELQVYYQPQVEIDSGKVVSAEALLRWNSDELGWVNPEKMIAVAEECGFIVSIGQWVMEQAASFIRRHHLKTGQWLPIAVNVSARQFVEADFVALVSQVITQYNIPAAYLELELTESLMLRDVDQAIEKMHELKNLGTPLALDDFGTGYTSLAYLKLFPVDKIKLDRAFVTDIHRSKSDAALAQSLVAFTNVMGFKLIAEGIEEQVQASCLQEMGVLYGQGFLYSQAIPEADFMAFIRA